MVFFPYMFLVYLALPVFYIAGETGLRRIIGFILLGIFLFTYRQLYFSVSNVVAFSYCLAIQMAIVFLFSMFL